MDKKDKKILEEIAIEKIRKMLKGEFNGKTTFEERLAKMTVEFVPNRNDTKILLETLEKIIQTGILKLIIDLVDTEEQITKMIDTEYPYSEKEEQKNPVIPRTMIKFVSEVIGSEYKKTKSING